MADLDLGLDPITHVQAGALCEALLPTPDPLAPVGAWDHWQRVHELVHTTAHRVVVQLDDPALVRAIVQELAA